MDFLKQYLLTILIFAPTAGAVLVLMAKSRDAVRWTALGTTIVVFLLSLLLCAGVWAAALLHRFGPM